MGAEPSPLSLPGPRSASTHDALLQNLRAVHGAAQSLSPPPSAREGWCRSELRQFYATDGAWKPLVERTSGGKLLDKVRHHRRRPIRIQLVITREVGWNGGACSAAWEGELCLAAATGCCYSVL